MPDNKTPQPKPSFKDAFTKAFEQASKKNDPLFDKQKTFSEMFQEAIKQTENPNTAAQYVEDKVKRDFTTGTSNWDTLTERDRGIVPGDDQNEVRAWNQSTGEKWKYGIAKGLITGVGSVAESTLGVVNGIVEATIGGKGIEGLYNNAVGRGVDAMNKWSQENMPHYYKKAEEEMGLLDRAFGDGIANFWSDKFLNGAGYFAGAYATGLGLSKLFQVGKFAATGTKLYETAEGLNKALKVNTGLRIADAGKQLGIAAMMAQGESATEGRALQKSIYERLESEGNHTVEEMTKLSEAGGNVGYGINLLITGGTDFLQFGKVISGGYRRSKKELNNILTNSEGVLSAGKTLNKPLSRALFIGKGAVPEIVQEGSQFATETGTKDYYTRKYDPEATFDMDNALSSFIHGLEETFGTTDGLESMFLGALLGGLGSAVSTRGEYDAKKKRTESLVGLINNFDKVINKKESAVRGLSYMKEAESALAKGDIFAYKNEEYNQFKSYVQQVINDGGYELLIDKLDTLKGLEEEEFKSMFGFDQSQPLEKSKEQIIEDAKEKIKTINKIYEDINLRFPSVHSSVKDVLFDAATSSKYLDAREKEVSTEIQKLTSEALLTQKYYNWANDRFNNNTVFKELEKDGEVQKDERGRFIELESKGKEISYEEFRKKAIEEYRIEYNKKLEEVKAQMNPLDAQLLTELTVDLNKIADLRESYINTYNNAITTQEQEKIIKRAEAAKKKITDKKERDEKRKIEDQEKKDKLDASKKALEDVKDKARTLKELKKKSKDSSDGSSDVSMEDVAALEALTKGKTPVTTEDTPTAQSEVPEDSAPDGILTIGSSTVSIPSPENVLSKEEEVLIESDDSLNTTYIDGEVKGLTKQEVDEETTATQESLHPIDNKGYTVSPDGVIENQGRLLVPAATAFAYRQREYERVYNEETDEYEYTDIANDMASDMLEPLIVSHYEYQVGEEKTLDVDKTFNIVTENEGVTNNESIVRREKEEGKENLLIPIAIKNKQGKIVAYLHDIDYIVPSKTASSNNNLEIQSKELKEIRDLVVAKGKVKIEINSKGYGNLAKNFEKDENNKPKKRLVSEAFPDSTLRFSIGKNKALHTSREQQLELPEGAELINNPDFPIIDGGVYAVLPTTKNNKFFAARVDTAKLTNEVVDTIVSAIEANIDKNEEIKNQIGKHEGVDIFKQKGLREFIGKFILLNSFTKDDILKEKSSKKFFDISNNTFKFTNPEGRTFVIKDRDSFEKNKNILKEQLKDSYSAIYFEHLKDNKQFNYSLIIDGKVENKTSEEYTDYIKDNTETNLTSYKISEDEYGYFVSPVITFKVKTEERIDKSPQKTFSLVKPQTTEQSINTEEGEIVISPIEEDDNASYLPSSNLIREINDTYKNCF